MRQPSSTEKLTAITVAVIAVMSPLYVDRKPDIDDDDDDDYWFGLAASWLIPVMLVMLVAAINITCFLDRRYVRFDPYWIHRVGGSSCGLVALLLVLGFVLKCKA